MPRKGRPSAWLGRKDADVLADVNVWRVAPSELVTQVVGQRLDDHANALEDLPGLHCVPDHADPGVFRWVARLWMPRYERLIGLHLVAHVVDLEGFQAVGGVLEAGE